MCFLQDAHHECSQTNGASPVNGRFPFIHLTCNACLSCEGTKGPVLPSAKEPKRIILKSRDTARFGACLKNFFLIFPFQRLAYVYLHCCNQEAQNFTHFIRSQLNRNFVSGLEGQVSPTSELDLFRRDVALGMEVRLTSIFGYCLNGTNAFLLMRRECILG